MPALTLPKSPTLGLGCWAIGGPFWAGDTPVGWGDVDDTRRDSLEGRLILRYDLRLL